MNNICSLCKEKMKKEKNFYVDPDILAVANNGNGSYSIWNRIFLFGEGIRI